MRFVLFAVAFIAPYCTDGFALQHRVPLGANAVRATSSSHRCCSSTVMTLPSSLNRLAGTVLLGGALLATGVVTGAEVARADVSISPRCEFTGVDLFLGGRRDGRSHRRIMCHHVRAHWYRLYQVQHATRDSAVLSLAFSAGSQFSAAKMACHLSRPRWTRVRVRHYKSRVSLGFHFCACKIAWQGTVLLRDHDRTGYCRPHTSNF